MRLIITFRNEHLALPVRYKHLIQGWIYSNFPREGYGKFIHDEGYQLDGKKFKMFVFSDLLGSFEIHNKMILYTGKVRLEIASMSEDFIRQIYQNLTRNPEIILERQILDVEKVRIIQDSYFEGCRDFLISTISPVTAYRTADKRFEYFAPGSSEFSEICEQNLIRKNKIFFSQGDIEFKILEVLKSSKKIVYIKNTFYVAYRVVMKIRVNYQTLQLIMNTGLSSKGPSGLGMVSILHG